MLSVAQVTVQFPHQERGSKDSLWGLLQDETEVPLVKKNINNFKTATANNPTKCKTLLSVGTCVTTTHVTCSYRALPGISYRWLFSAGFEYWTIWNYICIAVNFVGVNQCEKSAIMSVFTYNYTQYILWNQGKEFSTFSPVMLTQTHL